MTRTDKITVLIEIYKQDVKDYEELLEDSSEDGETNTAWQTYIDAYSQFIEELEELKEYYDDGYEN
nr:MAG TPA: hypothetical protein [Caudoviricetes sp.]